MFRSYLVITLCSIVSVRVHALAARCHFCIILKMIQVKNMIWEKIIRIS